MDLLRAAELLEQELEELSGVPGWKRRDLDVIGRASVRTMRDAAALLERLQTEQAVHIEMPPVWRRSGQQ